MLCGMSQTYGQALELPTISLFDDASVMQYMNAEREAADRTRPLFQSYCDAAYDAAEKGDFQQFLFYSAKALDTGMWNSQLFYDRGQAYENLGDYKNAESEYKIAYKRGYSPAYSKISSMKMLIKQQKKIKKQERRNNH